MLTPLAESDALSLGVLLAKVTEKACDFEGVALPSVKDPVTSSVNVRVLALLLTETVASAASITRAAQSNSECNTRHFSIAAQCV